MTAFTRAFFRLAEVLLVLMLSAMVVMVFGNVVLRYGFNTGIDFSEELSRFFFIWITFLGAIIAMRENAHLGLDTLIRLLPRAGKMACFGQLGDESGASRSFGSVLSTLNTASLSGAGGHAPPGH